MIRFHNKRSFVILAVLALSACAPSLKARLDTISANCDFSADPRFAVLQGKAPLSGKEVAQLPSTADLLNTAKPTPEERRALLLLAEERQRCRSQTIAAVDENGDAIVGNIVRQTSMLHAAVDAKLISGEWSYAQARQAKYEISMKNNRALIEYEQAEREKMGAAIADMAASMKPVTTQCMSAGSLTTCTSR
jgi:hypothetical protein